MSRYTDEALDDAANAYRKEALSAPIPPSMIEHGLIALCPTCSYWHCDRCDCGANCGEAANSFTGFIGSDRFYEKRREEKAEIQAELDREAADAAEPEDDEND